MNTARKIALTLCGSALVGLTLFNSLRMATLTRQVRSLEESVRVARPEPSYSPPATPATRQVPDGGTAHKLLRVVDGDTVEIETDTGPLKVRVIGIDTPETVHQSKPVEPGGPEATARAKELLEGQAVVLHYDPNHSRWDRYGRLLAYLQLPDGRDFGLVMVIEGYAAVYVKYPFSRQDSYLEAAPQAPPLEERLPDPNTEPKQQWPTSPRTISLPFPRQIVRGLLCDCPVCGAVVRFCMSMDKAEIKQIADFLSDVYEALCEGDGDAATRLYLTELYRVIKWLMDATFAAQDQSLKVLLATMEKRAREYKQQIEGQLAVRN